jgi:uncharacterized iron-regulated protein
MSHFLLFITMFFAAQDEFISLKDVEQDRDIPIEKFVAETEKTDILVLGEDHFNPAGHNFQLQVIQLLSKKRDVVIALEMFERDVQGTLDDYLQGRISEELFLKNSRPWSNYKNDYRPMIEFAKKEKLNVIAANIPRSISRKFASGKPLDDWDLKFTPRTHNQEQNIYWDRFVETMKDHVGTENKMKEYYASQTSKDDAMAESITDFISAHPTRKTLVILLCGKFHSDYGHGVPARILSRMPLKHMKVVSMDVQGEDPDAKIQDLEPSKRAHYIVTLPAPPKKEEEKEPDTKKSKQAESEKKTKESNRE